MCALLLLLFFHDLITCFCYQFKYNSFRFFSFPFADGVSVNAFIFRDRIHLDTFRAIFCHYLTGFLDGRFLRFENFCAVVYEIPIQNVPILQNVRNTAMPCNDNKSFHVLFVFQLIYLQIFKLIFFATPCKNRYNRFSVGHSHVLIKIVPLVHLLFQKIGSRKHKQCVTC